MIIERNITREPRLDLELDILELLKYTVYSRTLLKFYLLTSKSLED